MMNHEELAIELGNATMWTPDEWVNLIRQSMRGIPAPIDKRVSD